MIYYDLIQHGKSLSFFSGLVSLLFFIFVFSFSNVVFASPQSAGIIIPLYANPGSEWEKVIHAKKTHPSVPVLVIINPNNGPMPCPRQDYVNGITDLKSVGITTLGYVSTNYTARDNNEVIADINNWKTCYPNIDGVFFDEMSNMPGNENYYANLTSYAKSKGFVFTVGNPGIETPTTYLGTVDNLVIYEGTGLPNLSSFEGLYANFNKSSFSTISYGIDNITDSSIQCISPHVGYLFITNGTLPNPFTSLPPYFGQIVEQLDKHSHEKKSHYNELMVSKLEHKHTSVFKKFVDH